jgi:hypothetical protein
MPEGINIEILEDQSREQEQLTVQDLQVSSNDQLAEQQQIENRPAMAQQSSSEVLSYFSQ